MLRMRVIRSYTKKKKTFFLLIVGKKKQNKRKIQTRNKNILNKVVILILKEKAQRNDCS